ncbi:MAG: 3-hydroxyacyl-CoA dehydrogenase NAD-binding domain-containing protein [Bacteroidota bacterium]
MKNSKYIRHVSVLGAGIMGSRIACHFAQCGIPVLLLDRKNVEGNPNSIVEKALENALKSNPSPIYDKAFADRITTGNFEDHFEQIKNSDWIIEVIVEQLNPKQVLFEKVDAHRKKGSIVSSNTSGILMEQLIQNRSDDFKLHFLGTHFFNPPRYLKLLEVIPTTHTDPIVLEFVSNFGAKELGKETVICKDSPAFIANRIGVFSIQALFHSMEKFGLSVEEVDKLTGTLIGRPKSATFRTCDVVGLDTLAHVATGVFDSCKNDEQLDVFQLPTFIRHMLENQWLGDKTKQGFYKKTTNEKGEKEILVLDLKTLEYRSQNKIKIPSYQSSKTIENVSERIQFLYNAKDVAGEFFRFNFNQLIAYSSMRIGEISEDPYSVDRALKAGFGWDFGPFELADLIGLQVIVENLKKSKIPYASWLNELTDQGSSIYKKESQYVPIHQTYESIESNPQTRKLESYQEIIWKNSACSIRNIEDGIIALSWNTKMNTIGGEVLAGINKAIDLAESDYRGLVIYNNTEHFSAGANVGMIFMFAVEQEYEELDMAIRYFQNTVMRIRHCNIPVVVAPHQLTLGGACELTMHADAAVVHAETYMGLVEMGVGVIPGGAGTKEFALRASDEMREGDLRTNVIRNRFLTIGQAKVATSAHEAFNLGYLDPKKDEVIVSRAHQLHRAKEVCLRMADKGYLPPKKRKDILVLGNEGLGLVYAGANTMRSGNYISEHDQFISEKLGFVLCGGDLSTPTKVSEDYLLELERKTFLELCMQRKSLERMQSLLKTGKILRN